MDKELLQYDTSMVHLTRIIGKIRTYIDIIEKAAEELSKKNIENSFWNIVISSFYDLIIIESYKLIDKKNCSIFSLINSVKNIEPQSINETEEDKTHLNTYIKNKNFLLKKHRHTQKAHLSIESNPNLPQFADLIEINKLLTISEDIIKKYNKLIKGDKYNIDFNSIYAGGHKNILNYISQLIS